MDRDGLESARPVVEVPEAVHEGDGELDVPSGERHPVVPPDVGA